MSPQINVCFYVHHLYTVCADWLLKTCYFGRNIREHYLRIYFISSCYFWLKKKNKKKNNAPVQLKDSWLFVLFKKKTLVRVRLQKSSWWSFDNWNATLEMKSSDIHLPLLYREGLCLNNNIVAAVFFSLWKWHKGSRQTLSHL